MIQHQSARNDSTLSETIASNFGLFVQELAELGNVELHRNTSIIWYGAAMPHPMYSYGYAKGPVIEQDLRQALDYLRHANAPFFLCGTQPDLFNDNQATFSHYGVENIGLMDGMCFDLKHSLPMVEQAIPCEVRVVESSADYRAFAEVMALAAGLEPTIGPQFFSDYTRLKQSHFVALTAWVEERPVGCSLLLLSEGEAAGNYFDWVLPEYRKQGINSTMVLERLKLAQKARYRYLIAQCMDTSTRLYQRLGFVKASELALSYKPSW